MNRIIWLAFLLMTFSSYSQMHIEEQLNKKEVAHFQEEPIAYLQKWDGQLVGYQLVIEDDALFNTYKEGVSVTLQAVLLKGYKAITETEKVMLQLFPGSILFPGTILFPGNILEPLRPGKYSLVLKLEVNNPETKGLLRKLPGRIPIPFEIK